jgi:hypothetical protein
MPELLENQTDDLAKSGAKTRIHKIPAHIETLSIFLCSKERKLRVPNEAQFLDGLGTAGYPMTSGLPPLSPFLYIDKYLF